MKKKSLLLLTTLLIALQINNAKGQNALIVEDTTYFAGSTDNVLTISMINEGNVAAIQFDLTFDPDCFSIDPESRTRTDRTMDLNIFQASNPEPGLIRFAATGLGVYIPPGSGPIVRFAVDVAIQCKPGQHIFAISNSRLADPAGRDYSHDVVNGYVYVEQLAVVSVDDRVVFQNTKSNRITISAENQIKVDALQSDISFDTSCFDVTQMNKTDRTMGMNIFSYGETDTGVNMAMACICAGIHKGTGPIVEFEVDIGNCSEGNYPWTLSNTRMADGAGTELIVEEIEGTIAVLTGTHGDVNDDGTINVRDVILSVRISLGHLADPTLRELAAADCNSDGDIDISDILGIVNTILGTGNCPP